MYNCEGRVSIVLSRKTVKRPLTVESSYTGEKTDGFMCIVVED